MSAASGRSIFIDAQWTDVAIVGSHTAAAVNAGAQNSLRDRRGEFYRTLQNLDLAFVNYDLTKARSIDAIAVMDIEAPETLETSVTIRAADTEAALVGGPFDSHAASVVVVPTVDGKRHVVAFTEGFKPRRWLRVQVQHSGGAVQQLGWSRVMVGGAVRPAPGVLVGSELVTPGSEADVTETAAGGQFVRHLFTRRTASPRFLIKDDQVLDAQASGGGLWDLVAFSGANRPVVYWQDISLDINQPDQQQRSAKQIVYGRFPDPRGFQSHTAHHDSVTLDIEEWT